MTGEFADERAGEGIAQPVGAAVPVVLAVARLPEQRPVAAAGVAHIR
jgi:hypothetical protein